MANDNDDDEEEEEGLSPVSPPQVYQSTGDAERALSLLLLRSSSKNKNTSNTTNNKNPVTQYNLAWLQAMVDGTLPSIRSMETLEQGVLQGSNPTNPGGGATTTTSTTTTTTTSLILTYNRCLSFLAQGKDLPSALRQIYDCLQPIILFSQQQQQQPSTTSTSSSSAGVSGTGSGGDPMYHMVALQLGCLFLEIILIRKAGDDPTEPMEDLGFTVVRENNNNTNIVDAILKWMDMTIERLSIQDEQLQEMYHVMQFTVCLYTARIALAKKKSSSQQQNLSGDNNKGSHPSSSTATIPKQSQFQQQTTTNEHHKVARKELKQALEIFSTKFIKVSNPTNGETASLRSESQGSVLLQLQHPTTSTSQQPIPPSTISTTTTTPVTLPSTAPSTTLHDGPLPAHHHQQQQQQSQSLTSPVSVNLYQAALSLKARTEQLKGNVKKALILCQEAKGSSSTTTTNNVDTSTTTTTTTTSTTALPLPPTNVNKLNKKRTSATTYHPNSTNPTTTTTPAVSGPKNTSTTTSNSTLNPATPVTTMIHENNLAHVYATSGKRYLACHAWSKAVEKGSQTTTILPGTTTVSTTTMMDAAAGGIDTRRMVSKDGTIILPMHFTQANVVWNASMANLMLPEKSNYVSAYQGLASILSSSSSSSSSSNMIPWAMERKRQIRLWLRLGEACLGIHVQQQKQEQTSSANIQGIQVEGQWKGIVLDASFLKEEIDIGPLAPILGSQADMEQLAYNPLPRAKMAFETVLHLMNHVVNEEGSHPFVVVPSTTKTVVSSTERLTELSAKVSLSYICLEMKDYVNALEYARQALEEDDEEGDDDDGGGRRRDEILSTLDTAGQTLWKRQQASARMYASEAACGLGDATSSIKYLVGDGKNDAFDRLAVELGGVSLEVASRDTTNGKNRLAKAQAMVRSSASAASACLGNVSAAKQLAMSAQAMSREGSYATRALVYCLLQEGNRTAALKLLTSAR